MKNLFKAGTSSTLKQILQNTYMKRSLEYHCCEKTIFIQEQSKSDTMENNSLIYTYKENQHELYVIYEINNDELICKRQGKFQYRSPILPNYDWKSVGVYRRGPIGSEYFTIKRNEIHGKYLIVLDVLITCPLNVLHEK